MIFIRASLSSLTSGSFPAAAIGALSVQAFAKAGLTSKGQLGKPEFDVVTGVSTGALISPFAFLGDEESIDTVEQLYRNPKKDWVKKRPPLYFLPSNQSFATVPGLERELRQRVDLSLIRRVAEQSVQGRLLAVNTTDGRRWRASRLGRWH
jgi:hypothetical protein